MNADFEPSALGTKSHWDQVYEDEFKTYQEIGDVGEVWFGFESVKRMLDWLEKQEDVPKDASILDLGCGNGITLVELHERGYTNLTGVDYSDPAIDLAKAIAKDKQLNITYETVDILSEEKSAGSLKQRYKIVMDKGTYDAISLNPDAPEISRNKYMNKVYSLLDTEGLLVLTSCNWTSEELQSQFTEGKTFKFHSKIKTPTIQFGGMSGNREACVVFKKLSQ